MSADIRLDLRLDLMSRHCVHNAPALDDAGVNALLPAVPHWRVEAAPGAHDARLVREFAFLDYMETIAFVNALAWMVHREDHHPELQVGYRRCSASWTTHSAGNRLSDNDFICAAKADAIYAGRTGA